MIATMLTTATTPTDITPPPMAHVLTRTTRATFAFVGERLWLDFVNTDGGVHAADSIADFDLLVAWLEAAVALDAERAQMMRRRAIQQPSGATAALVDTRRVRAALRSLAERGAMASGVRVDTLNEINRVLGRSAGTRRLELRTDGTFVRAFVPVGDAFAGLMIPIVESAADALILGELPRVRRCADPRCARVFFDGTKNAARRWCDMATCGNRAKAARHRARLKSPFSAAPPSPAD
ncbi:MAG TPA: CGNR zinc finger domain-containing protein [Gemmatimonadaceae bacterium]|nr:CGNR zinc finger domain-containing protein [Gemmatimonadaceae bacterium]